VVLVPLGSLVISLVKLCRPKAFDINLNIDENLSGYFQALEDQDKKWMLMEEENLRKHYVRASSNFPLTQILTFRYRE
jgi:hypothetical protein